MYVMSICWEMMETEFQQSHDLGMPGWDHVEINRLVYADKVTGNHGFDQQDCAETVPDFSLGI